MDFDVARGEVMALVGDNGAGKSTLMKVLAGAYTADEGQFFIDGSPVSIATPNDASALGIQIVYQDLALCENLDVAANLSLGAESVKSGWTFLPRILRPLDDLEMEVMARKAIDMLEVRTLQSVRAKVGGLSGGQRQAIAIARAVGAASTVVMLDEPTAALGVAQTRQVLQVVKRLRETNHAVVYISHNLRDIFEVADRITVLRHGGNVATYSTADTTPDQIVVAMTSGQGKEPVMQHRSGMRFWDRFRALRESQLGGFVPVLLALALIWGYFGFALPFYDLLVGEAESFRAIFLSPRNIYNLFMQSAVIATLAVGITMVLLLGDIDLSAAATAGVCAALLGVLVLSGVPGWLACIIVICVGIIMGAAQGLLVAYIGIPSFVVTLAGLLGYQGLMQKILPTGNLNVGDPFVRSVARVLIPDFGGSYWLARWSACLR